MLPCSVRSVKAPPIKCQGIKTKLVPFIAANLAWQPTPEARWIEPFLGSGVVAFNLAPTHALLCDTNRHLIQFYRSIQQGQMTPGQVREFLTQAGEQLRSQGEAYYYAVRDRFNQHPDSLDFLFLNRSCFNGLMRFNAKGGFNVPFCRKPQRFTPAYITKIVNQVAWVAQQMQGKQWQFQVADWRETLAQARSTDFVYLDPPYIGRHTDYFNQWSIAEAEALAEITKNLPCGFALSMWLSNAHRYNTHLADCWGGLDLRSTQHFYHVGSFETLRGAIAEALVIAPECAAPISSSIAPPIASPVVGGVPETGCDAAHSNLVG
ncbi:Dam family site-specific DNA-(adenine-N6)-methyltransferase [Alkalinema sp. FACHB-956]|uniref:DNA adenine methylase n=1 Tax=Alkalinema sp. FACHB-956 TaxID=2692768 RepID=UPI001682981A|nr:Dam family site-specific DNA-(adenine-N6)-methyltransferase [Alkalinema sp. FACHB-956]MBD2325788.1 Dam family site-specific DNA-(adenine-N6)-methyltransferase [Alkalinema sp. FACHB-956]